MVVPPSIPRPVALAGCILLYTCADARAGERVDFNADVRPILTRHCFVCHGPDASTRKAGLRLDTAEGATAPTRGFDEPALVPGDADASLLVRRVASDDDDFRMPPDGRPPLGDDEIAVLRRWIDAGAAYSGHWAWEPLRDAPPPGGAPPGWADNPVDRFTAARLREAGLTPAPAADRAALLRRLSFDLTGLPPTPGEVDAFVADPGADDATWAREVDRLLASRRYGERWARHWLDLVRYAETYGHEFDYPIRNAWQYRDYVIRALNADVPYDRFVTEHIAGDLLVTPRLHPEEGYDESIIGTGFWFLSQGTHGPVDVREDEAERIANQIDVLSKAFLGVTVSCARCHDHKFDPVSTRDFYALAGFLQSSRRQDAYLDPGRRIATAAAGIATLIDEAEEIAADLAPGPAAVEEIATYAGVASAANRMTEAAKRAATPEEDAEGAEIEPATPVDPEAARALATRMTALDRERLERWLTALKGAPPEGHAARALVRAVRGLSPEEAAPPPGAAADARVFETFDTLDAWFVTGHAFTPDAAGPGRLVTRPGAPVLSPDGTVHSGRLGPRFQGTLRSATFEIDSDAIIYRVSGQGARIRLIIDGYVLDEFNALLFEGMTFGVDTGPDVWIDRRQDVHRYRGHRAHIEVIDDGAGFVAIDEIRFADGPAPAGAEPEPPPADVEAAAAALQAACAQALAARRDRALDPADAALLNWMLEHGLLALDDGGSDEAGALADTLARAAALAADVPAPRRVIAIADGTPEDERVFVRGSSRTLGEVAPRGFIDSLAPGQAPIRAGSGRRQLAERLLADDNPLPTRVVVNRVWGHLFGEGIVPTPDDFGGLGLPPSDPALLDWLALWLRDEAEWSIKRLVRLLVTSRTYRMSSRAADSFAADRDPTNRLLHRANVRRLEAEAIRDGTAREDGPARRRRPTQHLPGGASQLPARDDDRVRRARPRVHDRAPVALQRAGAGAAHAERPLRARAGAALGDPDAGDVGRRPGRPHRPHVPSRVRPPGRAGGDRRRTRVPGRAGGGVRCRGVGDGGARLGRPGPRALQHEGVHVRPVKERTVHHCGRFVDPPVTRRDMLRRCASGFGAVALAGLLDDVARATTPVRTTPTGGVTLPHHPPRARNIIFLYMDGGPSQVDTFDPKPRLAKENGEPFGMEMEPTQFNQNGSTLASPWTFARHGESGTPVSTLFPHVAQCADDLCVVRSMTSAFSEHTNANYFLHSGVGLAGRPSMGAWLSYGLGSENRDVPAFVVLNGGLVPPGGLDCFSNGFLPATHQGSIFKPDDHPVANIRPAEATPARQRNKLDLMKRLDERFLDRLGPCDPVESAIANYELAYRMQAAVPDLLSFANETKATQAMYGLDATYEPTRIYGRQCLMARRLVERGVRFIELTCPRVDGDRWDQHHNLRDGHQNNARAVDQPIAALLVDLKQRGLLDETLVVWAAEFGRTPFAQGTNGRDHNPFGYTIWLAGGGVNAGTIYGATDEYGYKAVENPLQVHDLHATMLHLIGIDHTRLTFNFGGRDMRLTDVHGHVVEDLIA
jgi:hypothetical protein